MLYLVWIKVLTLTSEGEQVDRIWVKIWMKLSVSSLLPSSANSIPHQEVVVAGMTVVTAYLLSRQTAAPGYTEVLAHLSMHSTHPSAPTGRLSLLGLPSSRVTHSTGSLHDWLTDRLSIFWDHLMTTINWSHHKHVETQMYMLVHSLLHILRIIVNLLHTHTPDTVCPLSSWQPPIQS